MRTQYSANGEDIQVHAADHHSQIDSAPGTVDPIAALMATALDNSYLAPMKIWKSRHSTQATTANHFAFHLTTAVQDAVSKLNARAGSAAANTPARPATITLTLKWTAKKATAYLQHVQTHVLLKVTYRSTAPQTHAKAAVQATGHSTV